MAEHHGSGRRRTILITGATSGIGLEAARALARQGHEVAIAGRNPDRGAEAVADLRRDTGNDAVQFLRADLSDQAQVRALAAEAERRLPGLNVLVNNAGGMFGRYRESPDGIEMTFALNHLSYVLLTLLLLDRLKANAPARIVNVASDAHRAVPADFSDAERPHRYSGWRAYSRSKLANILFTDALARRLEGTGVTANCLHPGFVSTGIGQKHAFMPAILWRVATLFARDPQRAARTVVYLAAAPEPAEMSGRYFEDCHPSRPSAAARDHAAADRLWDKSLRLTGLAAEPEPAAAAGA
jgi:NAD(P)-dependent dehydrogenase (short-subunit alcohol dehydrogenase family)